MLMNRAYMIATAFRKYIVPVVIAMVSCSAVSAHAQTLPVEGAVFASSPCALLVDGKSALCIQSIVPMKTELVARSGKKKFLLASDADGNLSGRLPRGRYTLKIKKLVFEGESLPAQDFTVTPSSLRVTRSATAVLSIAHR